MAQAERKGAHGMNDLMSLMTNIEAHLSLAGRSDDPKAYNYHIRCANEQFAVGMQMAADQHRNMVAAKTAREAEQ